MFSCIEKINLKQIFKGLKSLGLAFFIMTALAKDSMAGFFEESTGLKSTAEGTGHTKQKIFNSAGSLEMGAGAIIQAILSFVGIIFMVIFIYSGILWMTAGGNDQRIEKAKKIMVESIIGLLIVLLAYAITMFIVGSFAGENLLD